MNYLTQKNDRIRRRKARFFTALVTLGLLAAAGYFSGMLDQWIVPADAPVITETVAAA